MRTFQFTLVIGGKDVLSRESLDALFDAGCDDATFGEVDGVQYGDFSRQAPSLEEATAKAIAAVERSVPGALVTRIEPDDLVTAAEIAERLGRSRESVRLLIAGGRGPGGFPAPISHLKARGRLWRWVEVERWARDAIGWSGPGGDAAFIGAMNALLEFRRVVPLLDEGSMRRVLELILSPGPSRSASRVDKVLADFVFNPWDRDPTPAEARTLIADGLTKERFEQS